MNDDPHPHGGGSAPAGGKTGNDLSQSLRNNQGRAVDVGALASAAMSDKQSRTTYLFGQVNRSNADAVARGTKGRVSLDGYRRTVGSDELRHALSSHGIQRKETMRGQRAITAADLNRLGSISSKPDFVSLSPKKWMHHPTMVYEKLFGNERFEYVEAIDERAATVRFVSLRIHVTKK